MAVAASTPSSVSLSTTHFLPLLLRPFSPQPSILSFYSRPLSAITRKALLIEYTHSRTPTTRFSFLYSTPSTHSILFSYSLSSSPSALNPSLSLQEQEQEDEEIEFDEEDSNGGSSDNLELEDNAVSVVDGDQSSKGGKRDSLKVPTLTVKEKKELASYAHGLGKKLKCQLVGKSGVTDNVATSFIETLEANELLKIKIHRTCPGELEDVIQQLEQATGSVVVGEIGRTVIVYRPSLSKMKAEEKKKEARRIFVRKNSKSKPVTLRGEVQRLSGRGRRGSSRI